MTLRASQLHPVFFGEITGADLTAEPTEELRAFVQAAMDEYGCCVVRQGQISDQEHIRFGRLFGPLELPPGYSKRKEEKHWMAPELFFAGNLDRDGNIKPAESAEKSVGYGATLFHSDSSFNDSPTMWSMLRGVECPPSEVGGDTLFTDCRAAYDDLAQDMKDKIANLVAIHDFWKGREMTGLQVTEDMRKTMPVPPVTHPLVRTMPGGRKAIYVGGHCTGIVGMEDDAALALIKQLYEHCTQDKYVYRHKWIEGDIVIWDNRCSLHAATPLNTATHRRDMRRVSLNEYGPEEDAYARRAQETGGVA